MINNISNDKDIQVRYIGIKGVDGTPIASEYEKLWDRLIKDIGLINIILIFLGSILLIFSPVNGWEFDIPYRNYTLAYRGWLGIFCFVIVLILKLIDKIKNSLLKNEDKIFNTDQIPSKLDTTSSKSVNPENVEVKKTDITSPKTANPENVGSIAGIKSMYIHFSKDKLNYLSLMISQLYICNDYDTAMLLLIQFQKIFNGKLFFSPFIQFFAKENLVSTKKGENDKEWCWWYWDGGEEGFQVVISLCK